MDSHEVRADAIREGDSPLLGNHRPSALSPSQGTQHDEPDLCKPTTWRIAFWTGSTLLASSLGGSCLAAPFLFPIFQALLVPQMIGAGLIGYMGGRCRAWWLTGLMWFSVQALLVWHDVETNPFGYKSLYSTYVLNNQPAGFMYYHSWRQLYLVTIIPLTLGTAILTHGLVAKGRGRRDEVWGLALPESADPRRDEHENAKIQAIPGAPSPVRRPAPPPD